MLSNNNQTIVVTGSSGYVGSLVVEKLRNIGATVIEIDIHNKLQAIDLSDEKDVSGLTLPRDYILIHIAFPLPGSFGSGHFKEVIRKMNQNILSHFYPNRTLFISSTAVYPLKFSKEKEVRPWEVYGQLKFESEQLFENNFDKLTIFRPGTLVEVSRRSSMMKFLAQLNGSRITFIPGGGKMIHPFTYTHDLVDAIIDWAKNPNAPLGTFDLTALNPLTMNELIQLRRTKRLWAAVHIPTFLLTRIGSDRFPILKISKWHFRALCYDYIQKEISPYQNKFKSYKDIFTS
jgi:nucleoside-diphosphate-sugar epimerase